MISSVSLQKKRAWSSVYPDQSYQDGRMRILMNLAFESLKQFVGLFDHISNETQQLYAIAKRTYQKNQLPIAIQTAKKMDMQLEQMASRSDAYFHQKYQLEALQLELSGTQQRTATNNLPQLFAHSATYFMLNTLRYACIALSHSNVSTITYEIPLLEAVLHQTEGSKSDQPPAVLIYYYTYRSLSEQHDSSFAQLKDLFSQHHHLLPHDQQQEVLLMAVNVCIKRINTGADSYAQEAFDLYQHGLYNDILLAKGRLSRFNFKNIVSIGVRLQEFDWVESFIADYVSTLAPEFRESYQNFNLAKLRFAQGAYSDAKRLLSQVEYDDVFFNLNAKMMLLKIHFEEKDWDALEALLATFSRYLQRKSVIGYHKQVYQHIVRLVRSMLKLPPGDQAAVELLREEIKQTQPLAERDWLLRQLG